MLERRRSPASKICEGAMPVLAGSSSIGRSARGRGRSAALVLAGAANLQTKMAHSRVGSLQHRCRRASLCRLSFIGPTARLFVAIRRRLHRRCRVCRRSPRRCNGWGAISIKGRRSWRLIPPSCSGLFRRLSSRIAGCGARRPGAVVFVYSRIPSACRRDVTASMRSRASRLMAYINRSLESETRPRSIKRC